MKKRFFLCVLLLMAVGTVTSALSAAATYQTLFNATNNSAEIASTQPAPASPAYLMYDFKGNGTKDYISEQIQDNNCTYSLMQKTSANGNYTSAGQLFQADVRYSMQFLEDINGDGQPDISMADYQQSNRLAYSYLSGTSGYTKADDVAVMTNFDLNNDGRQDYLIINKTQKLNGVGTVYYGDIAYQQPDGSFVSETMQVMTWSEYLQQMTAEEREQYNNPQNYSLGDVSRYVYTVNLSEMIGAALARAPRRVREAQGLGYTINSPTHALDLNGDGLIDLIDEKNGVIYTNMGNRKWVMTATNGIVIPADLNGDGITDFIFPGNILYASVYDTNTNTFNTQTLFSTTAVDDVVYAQDFDHDGDIDLLATFSAANNVTGAAYTCFFRNDGQGRFTRLAEQDYGSDNLWFNCLQDINGDGYMDLLAIRGDLSIDNSRGRYEVSGTSFDVVWLRGNQNLQFADPEVLFTPTYSYTWNFSSLSFGNAVINAEDLNNDGIIDIWLSDVGGLSNSNKIKRFNSSITSAYTYPTAVANSAPTPPAAPTLQLNDNMLTITWGDGTDDHTMPCDLTYALRIGTSSGAMDILRPHANADGSRRNFLDGNMGRKHSYTINLSSYAPGNVYVAVQAIDAQHAGSAWSVESIVLNDNLTAEFTVSSSTIYLTDTLILFFTSLPEGYNQEWDLSDGQIIETNNASIRVTFPTGGMKTLTYTITSPDGRTISATQEVRVMPFGLVPLTTSFDTNFFGENTTDFNYDGRADMLGQNAVLIGTSTAPFSQTATGLWNTNFLTSGYNHTALWYDYNRDGHADLLMQEEHSSNYLYSYLPHNGAKSLSLRVDDSNVAYLFGYMVKNSQGQAEAEYYNFLQDFTHNGRYDVFKNSAAGYQLLIEQTDGTYAAQSAADLTSFINLCVNGVVESGDLVGFTGDFDHDGFIDLADMSGNALTVAYNRGDGQFEKKSIPFTQSITWGHVFLRDFNGDGYIDILVTLGSTYTMAVMWNNANQSFSAPEELPHGELTPQYMYGLYGGQRIIVSDIDGNGYPDVAFTTDNINHVMSSNNSYYAGFYAWFMGPTGIENHGWIFDKLCDNTYSLTGFPAICRLAPGEQYVKSASNTIANADYYRLVTMADQAPATPTGLVAAVTDEGLLIQWNDANDDHTPAALMRYNLSVRQQGSSTYLISPQNGGNNGTMPLSNYTYINATRFLLPSSVLATGVYEIAVQALDMQEHFSPFTATINVGYTNTNPIIAAATACVGAEVTVAYQGETTAAVPVWNFDGGTVLSGSGYGPYSVSWVTGGEKHITITVDGVTYSRTITIDDPAEMDVTIPTVLLIDLPVTASVPSNVTNYEWFVQIGDDAPLSLTNEGIIVSTSPRYVVDKRLIANGLQITAHEEEGRTSLADEQVTLILRVVNSNGCETNFTTALNVINNAAMPSISLVTVDENAHNVINYEADAAYFPNVRILKETNVLNQFAEVAVVPAAQGSYTDTQSDATQKADRYKIQGVLANGTYAAESAIHKTVHATISRGVQAGTYNLIWNAYEGADVVTYNILRGSSAAALTQIGSVAASATSYTDQAPLDAEPFYVVEYVLSGTSATTPARRAPAAEKAALTGRSNMVDRNNSQQPPVTECNDINVTWLQTGGSSLGEMTTDDASIWKYDSQYGAKATKQGGYTGHLMTPAKDLSGMESVTLSFQHAHKFAGTPANELTLWVTSDYKGSYAASTWQPLTISPYASNTNWTFVSVTIDVPVSMVGTNTVFAFQYMSTASAYATWEVKNLHLVAECAGKSEGIEDIRTDASSAPRKIMIDNIIYILRGDKVYTLQGQEVK